MGRPRGSNPSSPGWKRPPGRSLSVSLALTALAHHLQRHLLAAAAQFIHGAGLIVEGGLQIALAQGALGLVHGSLCIAEIFGNFVGHLAQLTHQLTQLAADFILCLAGLLRFLGGHLLATLGTLEGLVVQRLLVPQDLLQLAQELLRRGSLLLLHRVGCVLQGL